MLGRISAPWKIDGASFGEGVLAPRFAVAQVKEDGSAKSRAVDDMTSSGINSCCFVLGRFA